MSDCHIVTPLILSEPLSRLAGQKVYLKLDSLQPSGSFKIRGIGRTCSHAVATLGATRLVGSSGGNAGMAMAAASNKLNVPLSLFVPTSTPEIIHEKIKMYNIDLTVAGSNWNEANAAAEEFIATQPESSTYFVHPFEGEKTWEGHATMISEIREQLREMEGSDATPSAVVTCVGGGGLAAGLILGMKSAGWDDVPLVTMETVGADCFNKSLKAGRIVKIDAIRSIAKSLGALAVCEKLFELSKDHPILSKVVEDRTALEACISFAKDHRILVEPACGAVLSAVYAELLKEDLEKRKGPIVVVVCGGNMASADHLIEWVKMVQSGEEEERQ